MDALPLVVEKLEEVPETFRSLYVEKDGKHALDAAPRKDIGKFLDSKRQAEAEAAKLEKRARELEERFSGIDPEEARKSIEQGKALKERKLLEAGKVDELLAAREAALKAEHDKRYGAVDAAHKATQAELETTKGALAKELRDATLLRLAGQLDVAEGAKEDVLQYGKDVFRVQGGALVAVDESGRVLPGVTPESWLKDLLSKKQHWLKPSVGGGTPPKGTTGSTVSAVGAKPRSKMTDQEKADLIKLIGSEKYLKLPA